MTFRPAELFGMPPGLPDPVWHLAYARDAAAMLSAVAALLFVFRRERLALAAGAAATAIGLGFWSLALGRPYGVLVDPVITVWAADLSVAGWAGGAERFLAGEPGELDVWRRLASWISPAVVLAIPSLLAPAVSITTGLAIAALGPPRLRTLGGLLWLAAATGELLALRGLALAPIVAHQPTRAIAWTAGVVLWLAFARFPGRGWPVIALAAVAVGATAAGTDERPPGVLDALFVISLDQGPWFPVGILGLVRRRQAGPRAIAAGGGAVVVLSALGAPLTAWAGAAWYRLALILGAAHALQLLARWAARRLPTRANHRGRGFLAVVVWVAFAGGPVIWWDPARSDAVANDSLSPFADPLLDAMNWARSATPRGAAFVAPPEYAPAVAVLGGRRVLRAPGLLVAPDEERRLRLERAILGGRAPEPLLRRYGVRYLFLAPGQFTEYGLGAPEQIETRGKFSLRYHNEKGMRVYEIGADVAPIE